MSWTPDLPDRFFDVLKTEAPRRGFDPLALMSVMYSESGLYAHAQNPHGKATGILQFMPTILAGLGWADGPDAFTHLDAAQQLDYVFAYFVPWSKTGAPWDSAARIYQATFLPATLSDDRSPDLVLAARGGRLGWAYEANAGFDANHDKAITVKELGEAIARNCKGARWRECVYRLTGKALTLSDPSTDLSTSEGLQSALKKLGLYTGEVDGAIGPLTREAVRVFQSEYGLHVDGIAGKDTRAALRDVTVQAVPLASVAPPIDTDAPKSKTK